MIPRKKLEELKGIEVKIYLADLPDPHCVQKGIIESVTEHVLTLNDEAHTDIIYIPVEKIVFLKKL